MSAYAQELKRCQAVLLLRAAIDAGGNQCAAARAAGVHRNTIWRALHGAGYDSARIKQLAKSQLTLRLAKPPVSAPAMVMAVRRAA
jgi:hypothetical protein